MSTNHNNRKRKAVDENEKENEISDIHSKEIKPKPLEEQCVDAMIEIIPVSELRALVAEYISFDWEVCMPITPFLPPSSDENSSDLYENPVEHHISIDVNKYRYYINVTIFTPSPRPYFADRLQFKVWIFETDASLNSSLVSKKNDRVNMMPSHSDLKSEVCVQYFQASRVLLPNLRVRFVFTTNSKFRKIHSFAELYHENDPRLKGQKPNVLHHLDERSTSEDVCDFYKLLLEWEIKKSLLKSSNENVTKIAPLPAIQWKSLYISPHADSSNNFITIMRGTLAHFFTPFTNHIHSFFSNANKSDNCEYYYNIVYNDGVSSNIYHGYMQCVDTDHIYKDSRQSIIKFKLTSIDFPSPCEPNEFIISLSKL
jgi:hypothetical protein